MPAKDTRKIPFKEKAEILAEKRLNSATRVALTHGIARNTVYTIEAKATPELIELADQYHKNITEQAKLNVLAGLRTMHEKMADPRTSLRDLTPAVKVNHDIVQLQTGQPTQISANYEVIAIDYARGVRNLPGCEDDMEAARALREASVLGVPKGVLEDVAGRIERGELRLLTE